jgi:hypothetical protein
MWAIIGILMIVGIIAWVEVPNLRKKKLKKELVVFAILLFLATGLSITEALRVELPNPIDWITAVYKPMSDAIAGILQ